MITIIADRHRYSDPPADALEAHHTGDFVPVRRRIRDALDRHEELAVYATDPVVLGWLSDLQRYPDTCVAWRIIDPGEDFTELFGIAPTSPFTPACIVALHLHTLPHPPAGSQIQPLTWILGHRLDSVWQHDDPRPEHLTHIVEWVFESITSVDTFLLPLIQAQLDCWAETHAIYRALSAMSLTENSVHLLVRWALQRYDKEWRGTQPWGELPLLAGDPSPLVLQKALQQQYKAVEVYWNRQLSGAVIDSAFIAAAIAQMSGLSEAELGALTTMLGKLPTTLDDRLFHAVERRFLALPSAQTILKDLAAKVAPPEPLLPDSTWSAERWLSWATQQYMPYYASVIRNRCERTHQAVCALHYSEWLYANYPTWLNQESSPLLLCQYQDMCALIEGDAHAVVIWLIVDGMTWWQGGLLREACERHGLHLQAQRPGIAALPSITSVSKRALVTGKPTIDIAQPTIAEAARVKLAQSSISAQVGYDLSVAIEVLRQQDHVRVCVVLFNLIDMLAHTTNTFTDDAGIRGYFDDLAASLGKARQVCIAQGRRLHVLIGSDHGSTLLPKDAPSIPLPKMVSEIDDIWEPEQSGQESQRPGTRAAATDLEHMPHVDSRAWYILDRDRFQLDRHYLVPRGYGYIKRRPTGWTHGGLTPEETVVPLMHFAPERPQVLPLEITSRGTLRVGQAGTIPVLLRNLNPFPIQKVAVTVSGGTSEIVLSYLGALEAHEAEVHFAMVMTQGNELSATYEIRYNVFGMPQQECGHMEITLRRLQTEDTSFDDMFN